jgi:hypothetical protein
MCTAANCEQSWHNDCVSLKGLPKPAIVKLDSWLCPFCWVSPIPTLLENPTTFCYKCRNTLSLQQACSDFEVNAACEKLQNLQSLGESLSTIDVDKMKGSIETIQNFDLHLQHLITGENGLTEYQNRVKKIEEHLERLSP